VASDEGHIQEQRILLAFQLERNTAEAAETTARVLGGGGSSAVHGSRKNCCKMFRVGEFNPKDDASGKLRKFHDGNHLRHLHWMLGRKRHLVQLVQLVRSYRSRAFINKFRALLEGGRQEINL